MSESSDDSKNDRYSDGSPDNLCRDFVRGVCERQFCKYKHDKEIRTLNFCHDFQNATCPRPNCKFIHCSPFQEAEYKRTGEMSNQILAEATRKCQLPGKQPVCNQFRKGMCRRSLCKYRHITKEEEDAEIIELIQNNSNTKNISEHPNSPNNNNINISHHIHFGPPNEVVQHTDPRFDEYDYSPVVKRRCMASNEFECVDNSILPSDPSWQRPFFKGYYAGNPPILSGVDASYRTIMLEEENSILHKEISQLKKQVSDLTATNEFLLDQNATLRISSKRNVSVPAVTITNTIPQNNTPPQAQQVIRTVPASVVTTVPVSIATVTTCNPSGNQVSITACPTVSIAPTAQLLAPSQQILVTTNPSTQLAIANSSQAQLAIAQQNLANNLAQPQLTSQAQQLALANTQRQLTSQAQHVANQQLVLASASQQLTSQGQQLAAIANSNQIAIASSNQSHLTSQAQQLGQQLTSQAQQLGQQLTSQAQQLANQQLTSQAQQLALANTSQQLTSQAQQLALANTALANTTQQLTSQAQQLALGNTQQQLAVAANVTQQLALASTNQQLLAQQNLASSQQLEMHRTNQMNGISTSQAIVMSNATQPMVSYPIMTQTMTHALSH